MKYFDDAGTEITIAEYDARLASGAHFKNIHGDLYQFTVLEESQLVIDIADYTAVKNADLLKRLHKRIDDAAGEARRRFCADGWGIKEEYHRAEVIAREYQAAGYPVSPVPDDIQAELARLLTINPGATNQDAAISIIAQADYLYPMLSNIRKIRLTGKAAVTSAATDADKLTATDATIAQLDAIQPPP